MYVTHLTLRNFRCFAELALPLSPGLAVFRGANAQGKSALLEAVALLALTKSPRADHERDVIRWGALDESAYTRVVGSAVRAGGAPVEVQVDMALAPGATGAPVFQKRVRVDGVPRAAGRAVGAIAVVLFTAEDLSIVTGPPSLRRRYLDVLLSQANRAYLQTLQQYQRVLTQRNHLLRRIRDGAANAAELEYWDQELCRLGVAITLWRREAAAALAPESAAAFAAMAPADAPLEVAYAPSIDHPGPPGEAEEHARRELLRRRPREAAQAQTLVGPHRDEVIINLGGHALGQFGSRGQVRTAALALRLAEAAQLRAALGEAPALLLDDVLSELDPHRREHVLEAAAAAEQALLTVVAGEEAPALGRASALYTVEDGAVRQEA